MKNFNFNFKSIVQSKARWLLTLIALLTLGVGQMWATKTAIPANTIIYVDITNFHDDSHTVNNATDNKYYISQPNEYNVLYDRSTSATSTSGAGDYWPKGDPTWLELSVVSGNVYCAKITSEWSDGNISFWTKNESSYDNVWQACVALMQEYDGTNNLYTISSGKNYHDSRNATCFGTDVSVMPTFKAGRTLYLNADTYWDVDKAIFRAYFFNGVDNTWATCTQVGSTHYYSVTVPDGSWTHVIFVRKDPSTNVENSWTGEWNQTSDMAPEGVENCINITAAGNNNQSWGRYAPTPALSGDFNDWRADADVFDANGEVSVALDANSVYEIKVVSGTTWYGIDNTYVYGQEDTYTLEGTLASIKLHTASIDGTYKFTWNAANSKLSIKYPDVPHPNAGYVYFLNDQEWDPVAIHVWGGTYGTTWGSNPTASTFNWDGDEYAYVAMGDHASVIFGQGIDNDHKTADLVKAEHLGKYYKTSATAGWYDFTATLTLATDQGETTNPSPTSVTVTYGKSTNINTDVISTSPAKTGYTFGGYYTEVGGGGTQVITAAEKIPSDLSGYTTSGNWTKTGSSVSATLYAKWTETVTLDNQSADSGKEGTANFTATYNSSTGLTTITKPQKAGYIFSGYYTLSYGSGYQIIDADGNFNSAVTGYITEGKWTRPAGSAVTLYAYWKKECSASAYTIRYYTSGVAYESECFEQVGETHEWNITDFAIPSHTKYSVGYNEDVYESGLGTGDTKSSSVEKLWTDTYSKTDNIGNGAMQLLPAGASARAVGQATGAVGKLVIWDNSSDKNLSVGFLPNGYGLTYAAGTIAFNNWGSTFCETNVVTLTSADASGNFQVKLATSDSYVACAQGTSEAASAVNGRKISGGDDIANDKKGVFQMWTDATANNFGLRFVTVHDVTFNANGHGVAPSGYTDVRYNNKISAPDAPEDVSGWAFVGWYKEAACTTKWDFDNDVVTANTIIYARWRPTGVYTFHYGSAPASDPSDDDIMGWDVDWTGTVEPFVHDGATARTWSIADFEIPNPNTSPYFFVCWEEKFKTSYLNPRSSASKSKVYDWDDTYTSSIAAIRILPGQARLSDGTNTAQGAIGTLQIDSSTLSLDNLTLGFLPSGYGLTISYNDGSAKTRVIAFHKSTNDSLWETNVISDLTADQIAGTFKVGLATESGYVDCSLTTSEDASDVNARKIGSFVLAASTSGRFQIFTKRGTANFGLRWVPLENHTLESGAWGGRYAHENTKWTLGRQPTKDEVVYIENPTTIYDPDARAYSIRINKPSDSSIRLRIDDFYGGLIVETDILAKHSADGDYEATTKNDLQIATDYFGNGSLIVGNASNNTAAEYVFYTKAYKFSSSYINQYVGIPFASMLAYKLYGFNIFVYDADADDWRTPSGEGANTMQPWTAYNLIRQYAYDNWSTFYLDGTLNLPGITGDGRLKTLTCESETNRVSNGTGTVNPKYPYFDNKGDYMFANSWTAPISIAALTASDCSDTDTSDEVEGGDLDHTIFIFNAGYIGADTVKVLGDYAGTWSAFPFGASRYMDNAVIPATQAFLVSAKVANATLTLDYKKHVYDPAVAAGEINTFPTRAPRRNTKMTNEPIRLKIVAYRDSTEADNLYIFERGDFSEGYDDGWDGGKLVDYAESTAPQLYAIHGVNKLGVDAVKEMDGTNIGFKAGSKSNEYTFVFEYNDDEPLYLYDKETNALTQISNEATYEFTTYDTAEHNRFLLTRSNSPQIATGVEEIDTENVQRAQKFMQDQQIFIRRGDKIYSVDGRLVK